MKTLIRHENVMVSVETDSAQVDFDEIFDATEVVIDENNSEAPWDNWDGWEHKAIPARRAEYAENQRGYCFHEGNREHILITLPDGEDYGVFDYARARGASKGVAAELSARARQNTLDQLTTWYGEGWQWFGVKCDFEKMGKTYADSLWGIDSEDYAEKMRADIAGEVAAQLKEAGFSVINRPMEIEKRLTAKRHCACVSSEGITYGYYPHSMTKEQWRAEFHRNVNSQNWS